MSKQDKKEDKAQDKKPGGKRLGRGLDVLLPKSGGAAVGDDSVQQLPVDQVVPSPYQPRKHFDPEALNELASSVREHGVLQPVVARALPEGGYELVAGERRWRAAQLADLETIPAVCVQIDDKQAMAVALIENIQREDLHPLEQSHSYHRLIDEHGYTHSELAEVLGKSRATITNMLRLTKLGSDVQEMFTRGELELGHAKVILGLEDSALQMQAAREVSQGELSVRQTEELVRRLNNPGGGSGGGGGKTKTHDANLARLERELSQHLGLPFAINMKGKKSGTVMIRFSSYAQFEGLLNKVGYKDKD